MVKKLFSHQNVFILILLVFFGFIFREFWFKGKYPIPFNNLVLLHFPYNSGGWQTHEALVYQGGFFASDVYRQMIPWKQLAIEEIKSGRLPLWNPYNFSGEPLLANIQTTLLHPLTILFFALDFYRAWSVYVIASPLIATVGMYFLLKEHKLTFSSAVLGALAFGFSTRMITWFSWGVVTHSGVWLPLLMVSWRWCLQKKPWSPLLLIFGLYATVVAGYPQESSYALLVFISYAVWESVSHKVSLKSHKRELLVLTLSGLVAGSIMLIQIIPTFRLYLDSSMKHLATGGNYLVTQMHPWQLLTFFAPDYFGNRVKENYWAESFTQVDYLDTNLYIGPIGLFVVYELSQIVIKLKKKRYDQISTLEKLALGWLLLALVLATDNLISDLFGSVHIPMLTSGAAVSINYISIFCLCLLAGFGFNSWLKQREFTSTLVLGSIYLFIAASLVFVPDQYRQITLRNLVVPMGISGVVWMTALCVCVRRVKILTRVLVGLILAFTLFDYNRQAKLMITYASAELAYPEHILITQLKDIAGLNRVIGFWDAEITTNLHTAFRLYSTEGYNPLNYLPYQELISGTRVGGYSKTISRSDADVYLDNPTARNRFMELASVKYVFAKVTDENQKWEIEPLKYPPEIFNLVWQQDRFKIYEFLPALPRVGLYTNYQVVSDKLERINSIYSQEFDPHQTLILETDPRITPDSTATGSAEIVEYWPNRVTISTTIHNSPMILLLTDAYYPSWHAYVDGQETQILKANQSFRAVVVPEGEHLIEFRIHWP